MRVVQLCHSGCCPEVRLDNDHVAIGEEGNLCVLKKEEWNSLVDKIHSRELTKI